MTNHRILRAGPIVIVAALVCGFFCCGSLRAADNGTTINADEALHLLLAGNERFAAGKPEHPHTDLSRVESTAKNGQAPFAAVLSCADSRVPVETVFDRGVGDLFVVRVAGNVADSGTLASVEYAAEHLHTPLVVVMGHTQCGAVKAAVDNAQLDGSLPALIDLIRPAVMLKFASAIPAPASKNCLSTRSSKTSASRSATVSKKARSFAAWFAKEK